MGSHHYCLLSEFRDETFGDARYESPVFIRDDDEALRISQLASDFPSFVYCDERDLYEQASAPEELNLCLAFSDSSRQHSNTYQQHESSVAQNIYEDPCSYSISHSSPYHYHSPQFHRRSSDNQRASLAPKRRYLPSIPSRSAAMRRNCSSQMNLPSYVLRSNVAFDEMSQHYDSRAVSCHHQEQGMRKNTTMPQNLHNYFKNEETLDRAVHMSEYVLVNAKDRHSPNNTYFQQKEASKHRQAFEDQTPPVYEEFKNFLPERLPNSFSRKLPNISPSVRGRKIAESSLPFPQVCQHDKCLLNRPSDQMEKQNKEDLIKRFVRGGSTRPRFHSTFYQISGERSPRLFVANASSLSDEIPNFDQDISATQHRRRSRSIEELRRNDSDNRF